MKISLLVIAAILLSASAPSFAADMYIRPPSLGTRPGLTTSILHNYGPPDFYPGTTARPDRVVVPARGRPYGIYDGFVRYCGQSSANYVARMGGVTPAIRRIA